MSTICWNEAAHEPGAIAGVGASFLFRISFFSSVLITSGFSASVGASTGGAYSICLTGRRLGAGSGAANIYKVVVSKNCSQWHYRGRK